MNPPSYTVEEGIYTGYPSSFPLPLSLSLSLSVSLSLPLSREEVLCMIKIYLHLSTMETIYWQGTTVTDPSI